MVIAFGLFCSLFPLNTAFAAEKTIDNYIPMDIEGNFAYDELDDFINADIIDGYMEYDENEILNMYVRPSASITRSQFVKILVNALDLTTDKAPRIFTDVKSGRWYYHSVNIASSLGIVNGKTDGSFRPDAKITRGEMAAMIVRAFENTVEFPDVPPTRLFSDISSHYQFAEYINKAAEKGIISGFTDGTFKAGSNATRAQAVAMIHRGVVQEQSNLSDNQMIINFLTEHIKTENALTQTNSFAELNNLYKENGMGYYLVENVIADEDLDMYTDEIAQMMITVNDENMKLTIISKSNRFAIVDVKGITFHLSVNDGDMSFEFGDNLDGQYYLKRNPDGNWKIYNSTFNMNEELDSSFEQASNE